MSQKAMEINGTVDNPFVNETMISQHYADIPKLMDSMKKIVSTRALNNRCIIMIFEMSSTVGRWLSCCFN